MGDALGVAPQSQVNNFLNSFRDVHKTKISSRSLHAVLALIECREIMHLKPVVNIAKLMSAGEVFSVIAREPHLKGCKLSYINS